MYTIEMMQTDRVYLPGSTEIYLSMTGALQNWGDAAFPSHIITWEHPNNDFAALVRRISQDEVEIRFYNFDRSDSRFTARIWNLPAGDYLVDGKPVSGTRIPLEFPAGKEHKIIIKRAGK